MSDNPFLDYWGTEIHKDPAHLSSIAKAVKSETSPTVGSLDKTNFTCRFPADKKGGQYTTTLYDCNGPLRRCGSSTKPCKHMYRLAMECGLFDADFKTGANKNVQITRDEAIPLVESLPNECQKKIKDFLYICYYDGDKPFCVEATAENAPLLSCALLSRFPVSADALYTLFYRKADIIPFLDRLENTLYQATTSYYQDSPIISDAEYDKLKCVCDAPRSLSKRKLFQWCADNLSDYFYAFTFIADFRRAQHSVYSYLKSKFPGSPDADLFSLE